MALSQDGGVLLPINSLDAAHIAFTPLHLNSTHALLVTLLTMP